VKVHISNYGINSDSIKKLIREFERNNICYYLHDYTYWYNFGDLIRRNHYSEELRSIFSTCKTAHNHTFYRGKFYLCPRSAHCVRLNVTEDDEVESVNFHEEGGLLLKRRELKKLLSDTKFIQACAFCNGLNTLSERIPVAIQQSVKSNNS
jgi:hypothetical protein